LRVEARFRFEEPGFLLVATIVQESHGDSQRIADCCAAQTIFLAKASGH
jgi:hypothetical protein